jgi:hypothetical protein
MRTTMLTGGRIEGATRIDSACWLDGNYDEIIVEFWRLPGSILRTAYNRGTTKTEYTFLDVHSEAYRRMERYV